MARQNKDFLTQVREQAERTLAILTSEIRKREAELEKLLEQARVWRDALTSSFTPAVLQAPKKRKAVAAKVAKRQAAKKPARKAAPAAKKATKQVAKKAKKKATATKAAPAAEAAPAAKKAPKAKKAAAKKKSGGKRVDWDKLLASLPETFSIDDVMEKPGARAKGRNQVYPAINRWVNAKKAKKVGTGRYKRVG